MMQARHSYLLGVFEKLGTPLLSAVAEGVERERLQAEADGTRMDIPETAEAERIAGLLKSAAEMGFTLSRQLDLRMTDPAEADGVRLTLAGIVSPLVANLYRINGRTPNALEVERFSSALQAVTLFADNYNAAADANVRMQNLESDFAPADGPQVQLMMMHALLPAINAVCTFSFGQPEKTLLQDVMERLMLIVGGIRTELFSDLDERDSLRAEVSLMRAAANLYSQTHFTEMSKLMFMEDADRNAVDLNERLGTMWAVLDQRLAMLRVLAETLAMGAPVRNRGTSGSVSVKPAPVTPPPSPVVGKTTTPPASPFSGFVKAPAEEPAATAPAPDAAQAAAAPSAAATAPKGNPMAAFARPREMTANEGQGS